MPARDKHSGLVRKFVNDGRKKFYNIGTQEFCLKGRLCTADLLALDCIVSV
jgi:hypothetical protein